MAKDGTMRGGARPGSGKKKKPLADKILDGTADGAPVLEMQPAELVAVELDGVIMPPVKDYMTEVQRDGKRFQAEEVYRETWAWLKSCNCAHLVNPQLVVNYSMSVARWIAVEMSISKYGYLSKHPTTGAVCASPYVAMSREYMKQVNQCWYQINQIVRDNCTVVYSASPQDDLMERLLSARKGS